MNIILQIYKFWILNLCLKDYDRLICVQIAISINFALRFVPKLLGIIIYIVTTYQISVIQELVSFVKCCSRTLCWWRLRRLSAVSLLGYCHAHLHFRYIYSTGGTTIRYGKFNKKSNTDSSLLQTSCYWLILVS